MKIWKILVVLALAMLAICSCSKLVDKGPTNEETKQIFTEQIQKGKLPIWTGSHFGGKIKSFEITKVDRKDSLKKENGGVLPPQYSGSNKDCWPVRFHIKGEAVGYNEFNRPFPNNFDEDDDFIMCRTYQDDWNIDLVDRKKKSK